MPAPYEIILASCRVEAVKYNTLSKHWDVTYRLGNGENYLTSHFPFRPDLQPGRYLTLYTKIGAIVYDPLA